MKTYNNLIFKIISLLFFYLIIVGIPANGQDKFHVANVFGDNMVLQQNTNVSVWGWDKPGQKINLAIGDESFQAITGNNGEWVIKLAAREAGGPYRIAITGSSAMTFENVLFGDVWLASGQSNMQWSIGSGVINKEVEIASAEYPQIRQIKIPNTLGFEPKEDIAPTEWMECNPENVPGFSAVAYFFARDLYQKYNIPIGIINSSWGGTNAEAWTSREMLKSLPDFRGRIIRDELNPDNWESYLEENSRNEERKWEIIYDSKNGIEAGVVKKNYKDKDWPEVVVPAWKEPMSGVIYLRKTVNIPKNLNGQEMELHLGRLDLQDETFFNGVKVGGLHDPNRRVYKVGGELVRGGKNTIAIRLTHPWSNHPNMYGPEELVFIKQATGEWSESLAGAWKYLEGMEPDVPDIVRYQDSLASLYNAMIHPIIPYSLTGAIWYQGEGNAGRAYQYRDLFKAMITDWRVGWDAGYFPFLFVQLANFTSELAEPGPSDWAELREAQLMALDLPNSGMAVTIDIGEAEDIHPKNKQDVGKRLALAARRMVYQEDNLVFSGPIYKSMKIDGSKVVLSFDHVGTGLISRGDELLGFAVAGPDKVFHWANARISGDQIEVWSEAVKTPIAVRYAWANNPKCNLYNKENLPASPFRTDNWPGITVNRK